MSVSGVLLARPTWLFKAPSTSDLDLSLSHPYLKKQLGTSRGMGNTHIGYASSYDNDCICLFVVRAAFGYIDNVVAFQSEIKQLF